MEELKLEHAQVVSVKPGDVVVLRVPMMLTFPQRDKLAGLLRSRFPHNVVQVLDEAVELFIVMPES